MFVFNLTSLIFAERCFDCLSQCRKSLRPILYNLGFARPEETQNLALLAVVLVFTSQTFKMTPTEERRAFGVKRKICEKMTSYQ